MTSAVKIDPSTWNLGETELATARTRRKKNASHDREVFQRNKEIFVRRFTYDLHQRKFINGCSIERGTSLFFEFAVAQGEDVSQDYIILQMSEPDQQEFGQRQYQIDTHREHVLRVGIRTVGEHRDEIGGEGEHYNLFGCSNSQVQRHCFLMRKGSMAANESHLLNILPNLKDLEESKGSPKRVKYAGLMFSGATLVNLPLDVHVSEIKTFNNTTAFDFTDGVGLISRKLARFVQAGLGLEECPSVFQIRYCGGVARLDGSRHGYVCKGVLLVDPDQDETHAIQVRSSMLKTETSEAACKTLQHKLGVVEHSQPSAGRLGQQLLCLLSSTVPSETLLALQQQHLSSLLTSWHNPLAMAWLAALDSKPFAWLAFRDLLREHARGNSAGSDSKHNPAQTAYYTTIKSLKRQLPQRLKVQIPLAASRTLFGAVWPERLHEELDEQHCVVMLENGPLRPGSVIVSRSPSYHPGDVRVLQVLKLPDGHPALALRNCILFSTKGARPEPDKMGGGDLDGDKYLVIWHAELLRFAPELMRIQPASYSALSVGGETLDAEEDAPVSQLSRASEESSEQRRRPDWISYAAAFDNGMLGEVESTFYQIAKQFGVRSRELARLNSLFASLVDRNPVSVDELRQLRRHVADAGSRSGVSPCVWEEMAEEQARIAAEYLKRGEPGKDDFLRFQHALTLHAEVPGGLRTSAVEQHGSLLLQSVWGAEVRDAMADWGRSVVTESSCQEMPRASEVLETTPADGRAVDQTYPARVDQREAFASVERTHKIFQEQMSACAKRKEATLATIEEQDRRREKLCSQVDEQITHAKRQILDLDERVDSIERGLKPLRLQWRNEAAALEQEHKAKVSRYAQSQIQCQVELCEFEDELASSEEALGKLWWQPSFLSSGKRKAEKQREELKMECDRLRKEVERETRNIKEENARFDRRMQDHKRDTAAKEEEHLDRATPLKVRRETLCTDIDSLNQRRADILSGQEAARLQQRRDDVLQVLEQDCLDRTAADQEREELHRLTQAVQAMFCPGTVQQAKEALSVICDLEESMHLGLANIEREAQVAKEHCASSDCSQAALAAALRELARVRALEENRLLGFPNRRDGRGSQLPVYKKRAELHRCLSAGAHCAVVVTAGTGSGKSTQLPQYIADDLRSCHHRHDDAAEGRGSAGSHSGAQYRLKAPRICCTQPRRVAAQRVAERVARECGSELGRRVGFRVGSRGRPQTEGCRRVSESTVIEFVTEGLLLRDIAQRPERLEQYDCIIVDEAHERNKETDLLLALLREHLSRCKATTGKPAFKLVVMSASIDPTRFCQFLDDCPTIDCPGKLFPVEQVHRPVSESDVVSRAVQVLFDEIVGSEHTGDVLIFLSGAKQVEACVEAIRDSAIVRSISNVAAYPFYAELDSQSKDAATDPQHRVGIGGQTNKNATKAKKANARKKKNAAESECQDAEPEWRKVICCTNIAETSLTIEGVRFVIDSGLAKKVVYDHSIRCEELREERISKASAKQRRGRAGRTQSGWCYCLYPHDMKMSEYDTPAIKETPLEELILFVLNSFSKSIEEFKLLDTPNESNIRMAKERLLDWSFVSEPAAEQGSQSTNSALSPLQLTAHGKLACALDWLKPESVRMMLAACTSYPRCVQRAIKLGVLMSTDKELAVKTHSSDSEHDMQMVSHMFGDHFLALQQFEWFETLRQNQVKNADPKLIKDRCAVNGLDMDVLCSVQDGVERCHKTLKERRWLPAQPSKACGREPAMGDDECLLRVLIAGWFHRVVACTDWPNRNLGYFPLEPSSSHRLFELDRASCLQDNAEEEDTAALAGCISESEDDQDERDLSAPARGDPACEGEAHSRKQGHVNEIAFLVYGKLGVVHDKREFARVFMKDVSVIQGAWVQEVAPGRWLQRVSFEPNMPSLCTAVIKHVGRRILSEIEPAGRPGCESFFKKVEERSGARILAQFSRCEVRIYGTQSAVSCAKDSILERIEQTRERHQDSGVKARCGSVFFESGMQVFKVDQSKVKQGKWNQRLSSLEALFRAQGHDPRKGPFPFPSENVSIFLKKNNVIAVRPNHSWSDHLVEQCLRELKTKHGFDFKRNGSEMHLSALAEGSPDSWIAKLKQEHVFASTVIDRDVVAVHRLKLKRLPSWEDWWTALCREAHHERPFWSSFRTVCSSRIPPEADLRFVRSLRRFELFGPGRDLLAKEFWRNFEALCCSVHGSAQVHGAVKWQARWQVRRFASALEELRHSFPRVVFLVDVFLEDRPAGGWEVQDDWDSAGSEHSWLERVWREAGCYVDGQKRALEVRVRLASLEQASTVAAARARVAHHLCADAALDVAIGAEPVRGRREVGDKSQRKRCVMCRRRVVIQVSGKDAGASQLREGEACGWNLSLCGCAYCRECFRHAAHAGLADSLRRAVLCLKCSSPVLSTDCFNILKPKMKEGDREQCEVEWRQLCRLAESCWCQANVPGAPPTAGCFTCPDCGWSMVYQLHPRHAGFFACRNTKCPNKVCASCQRVVASDEDARRCQEGKCAIESADEELYVMG